MSLQWQKPLGEWRAWCSLPMETHLQIILSEELRLKNWEVIFAWNFDIPELIKAIETRGVIWDKNKNLKRADQDSCIETASYEIHTHVHWLRIKEALWHLLSNATVSEQASCA